MQQTKTTRLFYYFKRVRSGCRRDKKPQVDDPRRRRATERNRTAERKQQISKNIVLQKKQMKCRQFRGGNYIFASYLFRIYINRFYDLREAKIIVSCKNKIKKKEMRSSRRFRFDRPRCRALRSRSRA